MALIEGEATVLAEAARAALDAVPDPCLVVDRDVTVTFANFAARERLQRVREGEPLSFTLRVPAFLDAVERVVHNGEAEDIAWAEKVPTEQWFEAFIRPIEASGEGRREVSPAAVAAPVGPALVAVFLRDLTEQKRSERMRADFVANASHELRTPLASLTGFIETLRGAARDDASARETFLSIMHDQALRMRRLIDDLLSLSRVEMRAHVRPKTVVDLGAVVRNAVDGLRLLADEQGVALSCKGCDAAAPVLGDRDELVQVFDNLVANAVRYGRPENGPAEVTVELALDERRTGTVSVTVRDNGPGIAPEHLPRLTERFYRVDSGRQDRGTGLRLAIVKHILTRHHGRLTIDSTVGEGAAFTVRLALVKSPSPGLAEGSVVQENQRLMVS